MTETTAGVDPGFFEKKKGGGSLRNAPSDAKGYGPWRQSAQSRIQWTKPWLEFFSFGF